MRDTADKIDELLILAFCWCGTLALLCIPTVAVFRPAGGEWGGPLVVLSWVIRVASWVGWIAAGCIAVRWGVPAMMRASGLLPRVRRRRA